MHRLTVCVRDLSRALNVLNRFEKSTARAQLSFVGGKLAMRIAS
jgi:hypothetical protein